MEEEQQFSDSEMKKLQIIETISIRDGMVELTGTFGTVVLDRSRIAVQIQGPVRPGHIGKHMVIKSDGNKYGLRIDELRLLDDAIVDLLNVRAPRVSVKNGSHAPLSDGALPVQHDGTVVYSRRVGVLAYVLIGAAVIAGLGVIKNELTPVPGSIYTFIVPLALFVVYSWTQGPTLRRIEVLGDRCTIRYWDRRNWPRVQETAVSDVAIRTITCRINSEYYIVDILRASSLLFFLARDTGWLSQWREADVAALRSSGITVIGD